MRLDGRVIFAGSITVLAAWALLQTIGWPIKAALYPRAVGIALFILAAAETGLVFKGKDDEETPAEAIDLTFSSVVAPETALRRTTGIAAWMVAFYLIVVLIGLPRAIPLFVFAYLKAQAKESWTVSLVVPVLAWLVFYLLFVRLLHLPFGEGLLVDRLSR